MLFHTHHYYHLESFWLLCCGVVRIFVPLFGRAPLFSSSSQIRHGIHHKILKPFRHTDYDYLYSLAKGSPSSRNAVLQVRTQSFVSEHLLSHVLIQMPNRTFRPLSLVPVVIFQIISNVFVTLHLIYLQSMDVFQYRKQFRQSESVPG